MKLVNHIKIILGCIALIIAIQVVTYACLSKEKIPSIALELTPEQTHFAKGKTFSWVLLNLEACKNLTGNQKNNLLSLLRNKYSSVYLKKEELPENSYIRNADGQVNGYRDGFLFDFSVVSRGLFGVNVRHSDYEAVLAASSGEHVFLWLFGRWIYYYLTLRSRKFARAKRFC